MKKLTYILIAVAALSVVSCKKNKIEKSLDGSYQRTVDLNYTYTDSTTEVLAMANTIYFSRESETFGWENLGGVPGSVEVTTEKSDRYDDELELIFSNPDWKKMLPIKTGTPDYYVTPNSTYLNQCKFYLADAGNSQVRLSIVDGSGMEKTFLFTKQ